MTFQSAENKLRLLAGDRYYSVTFGKTVHDRSLYPDGTAKVETECRLYIDPFTTGRGSTWDAAFTDLLKTTEADPNIDDEGRQP